MIAAMPVRAHRSVVAALAFLSILPLSACQKPTRAQYDATNGWSTFGTLVETFREVDPEITAADVGTHAGSNQRVVLSGFVADVCQTMGCWLEIEDDAGAKVLVMNKDHAFFIPRNARGRPVHAIGWVVVEEHSVDFLKHLAMDAGRTQVEIDAKVYAGYYAGSKEVKTMEQLAFTVGRVNESWQAAEPVSSAPPSHE
jgi:hypothetical protein